MDSIKSDFFIVKDYDTLIRIYSVYRYHSRHTSYMIRRHKPVTYLKHVLNMEVVYERLNVGNY